MGQRILVADSATIQKVVKIVFSRHDHDVVGVASLMEAAAEASRGAFDLVIVDAALPGVKNPADVARLVQTCGAPPAIILVGSYEMVDETAFAAVGLTRTVRKPFEAQELLSMAEEAMGGKPTDRASPEDSLPTVTSSPAARGSLSSPSLPGFPEPLKTVPPGFAPPPPPPVGLRITQPPKAERPVAPPEHEAVLPEPEMSLDVGIDPNPVGEDVPAGLTDLTDGRLKGRRAFPEDEASRLKESSGGGWKPPPSSMQIVPYVDKGEFQSHEKTDPVGRSDDHRKTHIIPPGGNLDTGPGMLPPPAFHDKEPTRSGARLKVPSDAEIAQQVRAVVEDWCERNFGTIAREVISAELRRLAEEKARHLVDP
jgi:CheY-like chemotaxis protein